MVEYAGYDMGRLLAIDVSTEGQVPEFDSDLVQEIADADLGAFRELISCIDELPKETCIAPLAARTWEQGECDGNLIDTASPFLMNLWDEPCTPKTGFAQCYPSSWTCYGTDTSGCEDVWYDHTETFVDAEGQTQTSTHTMSTCQLGCFPNEWIPSACGMRPPDWVCEETSDGSDMQLLPPETPVSVPDGMEPMSIRQFYDTTMDGDYDPYIQPDVENWTGLSAAQCLEFCNSLNAECCRTEDGQFREIDGVREYKQALFACYAYTEGVQYPYQDPGRLDWHRVTTTKVVEEPDPDVMTPEMAQQMTCLALCNNRMSCGGWGLDPYEQINCARFDLRPGLTNEERCLARQDPTEIVATCEWHEDDELCEPKRECGTQCKMW